MVDCSSVKIERVQRLGTINGNLHLQKQEGLIFGNDVIRIDSRTGGAAALNPASALPPVKLITAAESYFLQAEAVARAWGDGDVISLYKARITASLLPQTHVTLQHILTRHRTVYWL